MQAVMAKRFEPGARAALSDLDTMLDRARPQAVVAFTSTADHPAVVAACARRGIPVMMEKPLAVGVEQARAIERPAAEGGIPVLVNYETTWYPAVHAALPWPREKALRRDPQGGGPRRAPGPEGDRRPARVPRLAHRPGPQRRRGPLRLRLLRRQPDDLADGRRAADLGDRRDPADQARGLSEGRRRGDDHPGVPGAQAIVQASWNWPFDRKDLEVYGRTGQALHGGPGGLAGPPRRKPEERAGTRRRSPPGTTLRYFAAVVRGEIKPSGLSSLREQPGRHRDPRRRPRVGAHGQDYRLAR